MDLRHPQLARAADSLLVLIDCQERLWKAISEKEALERSLTILLRGAALLDVPILATEQNPAGLGPTLPPLLDAASRPRVLAKATFSCCGDDAFGAALRDADRGTLVLCGIEAHICVLQTALDALARGYGVHVVGDACGSRVPANKGIGLARLEKAGAVVTNVESVLFEWIGRWDDPRFRQVSALLK